MKDVAAPRWKLLSKNFCDILVMIFALIVNLQPTPVVGLFTCKQKIHSVIRPLDLGPPAACIEMKSIFLNTKKASKFKY